MTKSNPMESGSLQRVFRLGHRLFRLGHLELLVALVLLQVIQSFLSGATVSQRVIVNLLFLAVVLSSIRSFSRSRLRLTVAMTLGGVAFTLSCVTEAYSSHALIAVVYFSYIAIFLLLAITIGEDVFAGGPVNPNRIIGAVCIFFVLGLIWAFVYTLLQTLQPDSFAISSLVNESPVNELGIQQDLVGEFLYFSNVTLTTLGYGDIVPVSRPARTFATLEAMCGELYLAIVIARMVGLYISEKRRTELASNKEPS